MRTYVNLYSTLRAFFLYGILGVFALYIACGNLFRWIEAPFLSDNVVLSELLLYPFALCSLLFLRIDKKTYLKLAIFGLCLSASWIYGSLLQGYDLIALSYALRLFGIVLSAFVIAKAWEWFFASDIRKLFQWLCTLYGFSAVLGFILFFFFSSSEALWLFLQDYRILFRGDPHEGRFVSVYFDPNYYACIVGIPLTLSLALLRQGEKRYFWIASFFFLSALLTWSRSGIFLLCTFGVFFFAKAYFPRHLLRPRHLLWSLALLLILIGALLYSKEEWLFFLSRLFHIQEDISAISRLETFRFGLNLFYESPLFGLGCNFLYLLAKETFGLSSIDSSLLALLIQFGAIPSFVFAVYAFFELRKLFYKTHDSLLNTWLPLFRFYGAGVVFFCSFFNNILLYPFWLLPFLSLLFFIGIQANKKTTSLRKWSKEE